MLESIPASSNTDLSHLAIELDVIALWGLMYEMNIFTSVPRSNSVLVRYALMDSTGQSPRLSENEGKKNSLINLPWRDCFARADGKKVIPVLLSLNFDISSWDKSAVLEGHVIAIRKTVFNVRCFIERSSFLPINSR